MQGTNRIVCVDGRKQRGTMPRHEVSSPTISTEAFFLIISIVAKEGRVFSSFEIPGSFLKTDLDNGEHILIRIDGRMAELLTMVYPKLYRPYIVVEKGNPVLYEGVTKGHLRHHPSVPETLETVRQGPYYSQLHSQPIRLVRHEQDGQLKVIHHRMACRRLPDDERGARSKYETHSLASTEVRRNDASSRPSWRHVRVSMHDP